MGALIGGVIGGVGSLLGGGSKKSADNTAAQQDLTGYNYLTGSNGVTGQVANGAAANNATAQLTGTAPVQPGTTSAFSNYLNSTGYKFQQQQGTQALTGSAAARGLLNSGATAKALTSYGQGIAGQSFNNYLGQLNTQSQQGLTASGQISQAGTAGGGNAGSATQAGGEATASGLGGLAGGVKSALASPVASNFFGSL